VPLRGSPRFQCSCCAPTLLKRRSQRPACRWPPPGFSPRRPRRHKLALAPQRVAPSRCTTRCRQVGRRLCQCTDPRLSSTPVPCLAFPHTHTHTHTHSSVLGSPPVRNFPFVTCMLAHREGATGVGFFSLPSTPLPTAVSDGAASPLALNISPRSSEPPSGASMVVPPWLEECVLGPFPAAAGVDGIEP
jgi:hypothetical protein